MLLPYSTIKNDFSSLSPDDTWSFKEVKRSETNYITHGYHRYPAKFIPQIVSRLISDLTSEGDLVLDPFGGCGTTLVEAKTLGRRSVGFDINPVAKLITETKITQVRRFYLCAFSHILKNCSRWLMKSIKPQIDPNKIPPDVTITFLSHVKHMMSKNKEFYELLRESGNLNTSAEMRLRDSTKRFPLGNNSVDLIVTSPPYVTSYEYADLHQLILLWLGDDPIRYSRWHKYAQQYQSFRKKFVGTKLGEHKSGQFLGFFAHNIISQLPNNRKYAKSVAKYFSDMQKAIVEMHRVLKPGGKVCIIIGNTTLAGIEVKNAEVAAEQMQEAGFIIKDVIKRELSNKMITPWRDKVNGRFTSTDSAQKKRVYEHEFVLIAEKPISLTN